MECSKVPGICYRNSVVSEARPFATQSFHAIAPFPGLKLVRERLAAFHYRVQTGIAGELQQRQHFASDLVQPGSTPHFQGGSACPPCSYGFFDRRI
jgi:hypothetical protein